MKLLICGSLAKQRKRLEPEMDCPQHIADEFSDLATIGHTCGIPVKVNKKWADPDRWFLEFDKRSGAVTGIIAHSENSFVKALESFRAGD